MKSGGLHARAKNIAIWRWLSVCLFVYLFICWFVLIITLYNIIKLLFFCACIWSRLLVKSKSFTFSLCCMFFCRFFFFFKYWCSLLLLLQWWLQLVSNMLLHYRLNDFVILRSCHVEKFIEFCLFLSFLNLQI